MNECTPAPWAWLEIPAPHQRDFADAGLWDQRTLADMAIALAAEDPGFVAFVDGDVQMTRAEVLADAQALSAALHARGLKPGDVVAFQVPNWREAAVINL
ncbi:MAG: AMP-binding protein, partial [Novosphingobium sp.]